MAAYYNEIDPYAAQWLRNLIAAGHLPVGDVDERDIRDVRPDEIRGYAQVHLFAGIGGWPLALRLAGWGDDQPVWSGSCPCQSFSNAGSRRGVVDAERHLWPAFRGLVAECAPPVLFGEQVASALGRKWLAAVRTDLEELGYAVGAVDLCAAGVGAPHIRQRLWWVAHSNGGQRDGLSGGQERQPHGQAPGRVESDGEPERGGEVGGVADRASERRDGREGAARPRRRIGVEDGRATGGVAYADGRDPGAEGLQRGGEHRQQPEDGGVGKLANADNPGLEDGERSAEQQASDMPAKRPGSYGRPAGALGGFWRDADWLKCRDGRWRPVEPGTFPLAHGVPGRVGKLRAYGNAICPQVAAEVITAYLETKGGAA